MGSAASLLLSTHPVHPFHSTKTSDRSNLIVRLQEGHAYKNIGAVFVRQRYASTTPTLIDAKLCLCRDILWKIYYRWSHDSRLV